MITTSRPVMRWFSPIRGDGEVTGDLMCEPCTLRNVPSAELDGLALIDPPDPIKSCIYCFKPVGNFNTGKPAKRRNTSWVKINGKIVLQ